MIIVIIGHSTYYRILTSYGFIDRMPHNEKSAFSYIILNYFTQFIYSFHMPFFMALSGMTMALSLNKNSYFSLFISKKVKRLILPFLTVTIFLSIPMKYLSGYWDNSQNIVSDIFFGQFLLMGNSHLWFIVSLFINMIATAKLIAILPGIADDKVFKSLKKNSYKLYLYSDPFNYLLILIFSLWMGYGYATDTILSIIAYLGRIILSIGLAYLVIWIVAIPSNLLRKRTNK